MRYSRKCIKRGPGLEGGYAGQQLDMVIEKKGRVTRGEGKGFEEGADGNGDSTSPALAAVV